MADCIRVGPETTREELLAAGVTEAGADELMDYRTYLEAKERGILDCDYETWRDRGRTCASCEHPFIPSAHGETVCQGCSDERCEVD